MDDGACQMNKGGPVQAMAAFLPENDAGLTSLQMRPSAHCIPGKPSHREGLQTFSPLSLHHKYNRIPCIST
jgi:hypothetical protein